MKSILPGEMAEIDLGRLGKGSVEIRPNVKILGLKNCKLLSTILDHPNLFQIIHHSQVFVVVVCLNEVFVESELKLVNDKIAKPMIWQIDTADFSELYFSNADKRLEKVEILDLFDKGSLMKFDFNFICNCLHSESGKFGKFSFKISEVEIATEACFKGKRLIDMAVEHGDLLVLRFLLLFQPDITAYNENKERVLEVAIQKGKLEFLRAILELSIEEEKSEKKLSPDRRKALSLMTDNGLSLLMLAARSGFNDIVKFLLKCGLNVNLLKKDQTACDFAWNNAHYDTVLLLIEADSPFPYDFDLDHLPVRLKVKDISDEHSIMLELIKENRSSEIRKLEDENPQMKNVYDGAIYSELKKISDERHTLHEHIKKNNFSEVMKFVEKNPQLKSVYDSRCQCALVTALQSKNFDIYSFLRSKGFTSGIDEDHKIILSSLTPAEKDELKFSNREYFTTNENGHIMDLLARSRLGFGSDQKNFAMIQKFFEALDSIPEVQPILQVISLAESLDIVFDFNQSGVADMDPTQNFDHLVVKGRTIYNNGNILIGAKGTESEVLATMAHEFTHYAVHLIYGNLGFPYKAADETREEEFCGIIGSCERIKSKNPVIENVFTSYPSQEWAAELIVQVPHLLALHHQEPSAVKQISKDFDTLFKFFNDEVLPECKLKISVIKDEQKVQELNQVLNLKRETEASTLFCDSGIISFDNILNTTENILIQSSTPKLVLCNLLKYFDRKGTQKVDSQHIFIELDQLLDQKNGKMIFEAFQSTIKPKLFALEQVILEFAKIKDFYNHENMRSRVVTITKPFEVDENFKLYFPRWHRVEYCWNELSEISKTKVLSSKIKFQGRYEALNEFLTAKSQILNELTLEEVFELSGIELKSLEENEGLTLENPRIFIERTFVDTSKQTDTMSTKDFIEELISKKSLILSADSGMGKTVSALHISDKLKRRNPLRWVVYIDLKQYTECYYEDKNEAKHVDSTPAFFARILKLERRNAMKFFEHFYNNAEVIFIIDGFDEISPPFAECILNVLKNIQKSQNLFIVTSSKRSISVLENNLPSKVIKLKPLTTDEQIDSIVKIWSHSAEEPRHQIESRAHSLLRSLKAAKMRKNFFSAPLNIRMLAEIYADSFPAEIEIQEINIFTFHQKFIQKRIDILIERGLLAKEEKMQNTIMQNFQKLSFKSFFAADETKLLLLPEIREPLTGELLVNIGIVALHKTGKFLFKHQSLSEYFLTDFILTNIATDTQLVESEKLHQIFLEIIHHENFKRVRSLMNGRLELNEKLNVASFSVNLEKSLANESNQKFFVLLVEEKLSSLIKFILQTITISKKIKINLINQTNKHKENALLVAVRNRDSSLLKLLWTCIENFTATNERKDLLLSCDYEGYNVLKFATFSGREEIFKETLDIAANSLNFTAFKELLMQEDETKSNALLTVVQNFPAVFDMLWETIELKLGPEGQKELLFSVNSNRRNVFLLAIYRWCKNGETYYQHVIKSIMQKIKNLFNYDEKREFLFAEESSCRNAIDIAVFFSEKEAFTMVWDFIKDVLSLDDQKKFWLRKNERNLFITSVVRFAKTKKTIVKEVVSAAKEALEPEEFRSVLSEEGLYGVSFIKLATDLDIVKVIFEREDQCWVAEENEDNKDDSRLVMPSGSCEIYPILQTVRFVLEDNLKIECIKLFLFDEIRDGDKLMLYVLEYGTTFLVKRIFYHANKLSPSDRLEIIKSTDSFGRNIFDRLDLNINNNIEFACNFLIEQSDLVSEVKAFFFKNRHTILSKKCMLNRNFIDILNWLKNNSSQDEFSKWFFEGDCNMDFLIYNVAEYSEKMVMNFFFSFCLSSFDGSKMKRMLLSAHCEGDNMLGRSLFNQNSDVIFEMWNYYVHVLDEIELGELFLKNNQGRNYFKKSKGKNPEAVMILKAIAAERHGAQNVEHLFR